MFTYNMTAKLVCFCVVQWFLMMRLTWRMVCMFQLLTVEYEVRFSILAPDSILAAAYIVGTEEFVAIGNGFCGVSLPLLDICTHL